MLYVGDTCEGVGGERIKMEFESYIYEATTDDWFIRLLCLSCAVVGEN